MSGRSDPSSPKRKRQVRSGSSDQATAATPEGSPHDTNYRTSQTEQALDTAEMSSEQHGQPPVIPFRFRDFTAAPSAGGPASLELIRDVELDLKIELGRTQMYLEDVLKLRKGSVVPLDKLAGEPVDVVVNGRRVARGEVLVLNDNFCVRVTELISDERAA